MTRRPLANQAAAARSNTADTASRSAVWLPLTHTTSPPLSGICPTIAFSGSRPRRASPPRREGPAAATGRDRRDLISCPLSGTDRIPRTSRFSTAQALNRCRHPENVPPASAARTSRRWLRGPVRPTRTAGPSTGQPVGERIRVAFGEDALERIVTGDGVGQLEEPSEKSSLDRPDSATSSHPSRRRSPRRWR